MHFLEEYNSINGESVDNSLGPLMLKLGDHLYYDNERYRLIRNTSNTLSLLRESDSTIVVSTTSTGCNITVDALLQLVSNLLMRDVELSEFLSNWQVDDSKYPYIEWGEQNEY